MLLNTTERAVDDPDTRILHRIKPREVFAEISGDVKVGVIADVETTGLDHQADRVIELGAIRFTFDGEGRVGQVLDFMSAIVDPGRPIPAEITALTGITDEIVAGRELDGEAVEGILDGAAVAIAHNAGFDRRFCEALHPAFRPLAWACSVEQIPWKDHGIRSKALDYIAFRYGLFYDGHRALDDCVALLEILSRPIPGGDGSTGLRVLLDNARRPMARLWALRSPFDRKDDLKARGYVWANGEGGRPKSWFRDLPAADVEAEVEWLRETVFGGGYHFEPKVDRLSVFDRFSERET